MDAYDAARVVFSRIQSLDPANAAKIMGLLLITHDDDGGGHNHMIRLAFSPDPLLRSLVLTARNHLHLLLPPPPPSLPSPPRTVLNPCSRQIYLTFPADSTFTEEDVSAYFSTFGPVHDVRIPYQQKRMFGFVSFLYADTVKLILAIGNPHLVCDSRVLVKPYKEKPRALDKYRNLQQQQPLGSTSSGQEALLPRRKAHEQAIELQRQRFMRLQLLGLSPSSLPNETTGAAAAETGSAVQRQGVEVVLPESPFASPTRPSHDSSSVHSIGDAEAAAAAAISSTKSGSNHLMASYSKSCFFKMPADYSGASNASAVTL